MRRAHALARALLGAVALGACDDDDPTATLAAGQVRTAIAVDAPGGGAPFGALLLADRN